VAAGCVLNVELNFALIPRMSYVGAAYSTIATEFFVAAAGLAYLLHIGYSPMLVGSLPKIILAAAVMSPVTYYSLPLGLIPSVALSAVVYCGILSASGVVSKEELLALTRAA